MQLWRVTIAIILYCCAVFTLYIIVIHYNSIYALPEKLMLLSNSNSNKTLIPNYTNTNNILITTIVNWANHEITSNWINTMILFGYFNNILLILTDESSFNFWSVDKRFNISDKILLYKPLSKLNLTNYYHWGNDPKFNQFTCFRPIILNDLLFNNEYSYYWKNHNLINFRSIFYIDTDAIFLKSKILLQNYLKTLYQNMSDSENIYFSIGEGGRKTLTQEIDNHLMNISITSNYTHSEQLNSYSNICDSNVICTGLIYFHDISKWSSNKTVNIRQFLIDWNKKCQDKKSDDQAAINPLLKGDKRYGYTFRNNHVHILDCNKFPNGPKFQRKGWKNTFIIDSNNMNKYRNKSWFPYVFHANGKIGKKQKINFLKQQNLWLV